MGKQVKMQKMQNPNKNTDPGVQESAGYMVYTSNIHLVYIMTSENEKGLRAQGNFSRSKGVNGLIHDCWQSGRLRTGLHMECYDFFQLLCVPSLSNSGSNCLKQCHMNSDLIYYNETLWLCG
ncbi:hypothetical protein RDI58_000356 [Solanum bulbocastanum]|uniref:Uncharacterized protein n=1 Tax=Solanum bulbocastanum TaxID=147425 RepID=A0AAN8YP27_SOLBU